jgi:hypothetical protein
MKLRHLAAWIFGAALIGMGATFLRAQQLQAPREGAALVGRDKLRADIIKLRTEVERLDFDYQIAREFLRGDVSSLAQHYAELRLDKIKVFEVVGGLDWSITIKDGTDSKPAEGDAQQTPDLERKTAPEESTAPVLDLSGEAAVIAAMKKELARHFAILAEKRLDLDDAERRYRELSR